MRTKIIELDEDEYLTFKQKVEDYERMLHAIYLASITLDNKKIKELVEQIAVWGHAHQGRNGQATDFEREQDIFAASARFAVDK